MNTFHSSRKKQYKEKSSRRLILLEDIYFFLCYL
nr:MAG TPA: hypothetical protein [Caudoviricetes sp.]